MKAQELLLGTSRTKGWEMALWLALLLAPLALPMQALIINEIAIVACSAAAKSMNSCASPSAITPASSACMSARPNS